MFDRTEIRITGSGGQGVVLAAQILGNAAVLDGKNAVQTQAYGSEARGSLSRGEIIISEGKIHFPSVRESDILIAMNQESLNVFIKRIKETGLLIKPDSHELADTILYLLSNKLLREKMGSSGRKFVSEKFSLDTCAKKMLQVYSEASKTLG